MNTLYIQLFVICMDVYTNQKISNAFSIDFHLVSLQKMLKLETGLRSRGAVCPLAEWGEGGEAALFFFLGRVVYWRLFLSHIRVIGINRIGKPHASIIEFYLWPINALITFVPPCSSCSLHL